MKDQLFHYTTVEGLIGILESKSLHAGKIHYLNDSKEFLYASDVCNRVVALSKNLEPIEVVRLFEKVADFFSKMIGGNIFIISLSENPNSLSQWRAYAPSGGYSIGFSTVALAALAGPQKFKLARCIYDEKEQDQLMYGFMRSAADRLKQINAEDEEGERKLFGKLYLEYCEIASTMKDPGFEEEKEWRLIGGPVDLKLTQIAVKAKNSIAVPYFKFHLSNGKLTDLPNVSHLGINTIWIGPNRNQPLARLGLEDLLQHYGIHEVEPLESNIPYRID